jgi:hypothetical protein
MYMTTAAYATAMLECPDYFSRGPNLKWMYRFLMRDCTPGQREQLGLSLHGRSGRLIHLRYHQLFRFHQRYHRLQIIDEQRGVARSHRFLKERANALRVAFDTPPGEPLRITMDNWLIQDTYPKSPSFGVFAADTTITKAFSRSPSRPRCRRPAKKVIAGQVARKKPTPRRKPIVNPADLGAAWTAKKNSDGSTSYVWGHGVNGIAGRWEEGEFVVSVSTLAANSNHKNEVLRQMRRLGPQMDELGLTNLIVDKGFSDSANFLNGVRDLGVSPTFELKVGQYGLRGSHRGCLEIDGRLWLPSLPEKLRRLPRPAPGQKKARENWNKTMDAREPYALEIKERISPFEQRVRSRGLRPRGPACKHQELPQTRRPGGFDPALVACRGQHLADEACGLQSATWKATDAPLTFQDPPHGTGAWRELMGQRQAIERAWNDLKNADCSGAGGDHLRWRGLSAVGMYWATSVAASNLRKLRSARAE